MSLITGIIRKTSCRVLILLALLAMLTKCSNKGNNNTSDDKTEAKGKIEVTFTNPRIGNISQTETLNATTLYQINETVRAPIGGYVQKIYAEPGQVINTGDILFTMQSKEAAALGNLKDSLFPAKGLIQVKATAPGIVKSLSRQAGDYLQDGDELCTIANNSSQVFMLDVPYEMHKYIKTNLPYSISLPDGEIVKANIISQAPGMDKAVQMERYILKSSSPTNLPEGLIGNVNIPTLSQNNTIILPKTAVLCNETQTKFWVMKLLSDSIAVKVDIEKGIQTKDSVEIKSPPFKITDRILTSGNYGVGDTILVKTDSLKE